MPYLVVPLHDFFEIIFRRPVFDLEHHQLIWAVRVGGGSLDALGRYTCKIGMIMTRYIYNKCSP